VSSSPPGQVDAPRARTRRGQTAPLPAASKLPPQPPVAPVAPAPAVVQHAPGRAPGARVLVQWANGHKYPGVVEQITGPQCFVRFDTGERRWVESRYVLPA
jgi:hypothetical protein